MEDFACAPCIEEEHYLVDACTHGHSKLKESGMSCQICVSVHATALDLKLIRIIYRG